MKRAMWIGIAATVALASGCATAPYQVGSQRVVETSPKTEPNWIGRSSWEEEGQYFYVGAVTNRQDMALGLREAKAEGEKKLAEQIRQRIRTEFGSALEGQNLDGNTGSYVKDLIAKVSDNVEVSGVRMEETFVEKIEETTGAGVRYIYNCYAKLRLDKADYSVARQRVLSIALADAKSAANAKAEESLRRAMRRLEDLPGMSAEALPMAVAGPRTNP